MSLKEQIAYLKGLVEGLEINTETKEGKIILSIITTLEIIGNEIEDLIEDNIELSEELDAISDDLADVEEFIFDDDDIDDDLYDYDDDDFYDDDDDIDDIDDDIDDDSDLNSGDCNCNLCNNTTLTFDVQCPACGAEIGLSETDLASDGINCPKCDEHLEFDFEDGEDIYDPAAGQTETEVEQNKLSDNLSE